MEIILSNPESKIDAQPDDCAIGDPMRPELGRVLPEQSHADEALALNATVPMQFAYWIGAAVAGTSKACAIIRYDAEALLDSVRKFTKSDATLSASASTAGKVAVAGGSYDDSMRADREAALQDADAALEGALDPRGHAVEAR